MKRWWLVIVLLLSLGINLGLLAAVMAHRLEPESPPSPPDNRPATVAHPPAPAPPATPRVEESPVPSPEPDASPTPASPQRTETPRREETRRPSARPRVEEEPGPGPGLGPGEGPEGPGPEGPPEGDPPRLTRLADELGIEGETRQRFLDIQWRLFERTSRLRIQQDEVHRELRRALVRGTPDRQRIQTLLNESARIHRALETALAENVLATREVLTPEQERRYLQFVARSRREGGGPPPMGGPLMRRRPPPWQERRRDRFGRPDRFGEGLPQDRPEGGPEGRGPEGGSPPPPTGQPPGDAPQGGPPPADRPSPPA